MWNCESRALQLAKVQATLKKHMAFNWKTLAPSITQISDAPLCPGWSYRVSSIQKKVEFHSQASMQRVKISTSMDLVTWSAMKSCPENLQDIYKPCPCWLVWYTYLISNQCCTDYIAPLQKLFSNLFPALCWSNFVGLILHAVLLVTRLPSVTGLAKKISVLHSEQCQHQSLVLMLQDPLRIRYQTCIQRVIMDSGCIFISFISVGSAQTQDRSFSRSETTKITLIILFHISHAIRE